jgi:hypothetical protein
MSNGRRFRRQLGQRAVFFLPPIPDGGSHALKDALATRNAASRSGRCRCGAEGTFAGTDDLGVMQLVFMHEEDCPAGDERLAELRSDEA